MGMKKLEERTSRRVGGIWQLMELVKDGEDKGPIFYLGIKV